MADVKGVHVKFTGDAEGLKGALKETQEKLKGTEQSAEKTTQSLRGMASGLAKLAVAAVGVGGIATLFKNVAREAETFETSMLRINAVIRATGGVAGKTGDELLAFAQNLARNTLESTEGVLEAQQRLLTFRKITGDVFDRAIKASADLSAAMGTNLSASAVMLGRALEDPERGLTALTRTGTVFTEAQKEMVAQLVETGNLQEAQTLILKELEAQYGGTAQAAAQGYAGALDTLAQSQQEFLLAINDTLGVTDALSVAVNALSSVFDTLSENMERVVTYIQVAAVAGMVAFRGAIIGAAAAITKLLIPGLVAFKTALARTGVGLLVVALGEAAYQASRLYDWFGDLTTAAGGTGEAIGLLGQLVGETFTAIGRDGPAIAANAFKAIGYSIIASMQRTMSKVLLSVLRTVEAMRDIPGLDDVANVLAQRVVGAYTKMRQSADLYASQAADANGRVAESLKTPLETLERMRALMAGTVEGPEGGDGAGADQRADALRDALARETEIIAAEHAKRQEMLDNALAQEITSRQDHYAEGASVVAQGFGSLSRAAERGGKGMAKAAATLGAVQALINAFVAASQALADPTAITPAQKFAAYAAVLAQGMAAVAAIKQAGASIGAGGGGGGGAAAGGAASAPSKNVAIQLTGGDMYSRDQVGNLINQINEAVEDGATLRLV